MVVIFAVAERPGRTSSGGLSNATTTLKSLASWEEVAGKNEPKDGATVTNPVHVKFAVEGMKIAPAGTMTDGTGHHHLLIDGQPVPKGTVIPANDKSLHFGKGQSETEITLPPGDHTLTLQFGDGAHRSYGPEWSKTITIHVK